MASTSSSLMTMSVEAWVRETSPSTTTYMSMTNATVNDDHQHLFLFAKAALLVPLVIIGLIGNALVCIAIYTERQLQNVTNFFLFSLAVADCLVCSCVMPIAIVVEYNDGSWLAGAYSFEACLFYIYADVFLCTASIVHMCVISFDRYMGISRPLTMRNTSHKIVFGKIFGVWTATVVISSPIALMSLGQECYITSAYYIAYGSTCAFFIPLAIMVVSYYLTTKMLREQTLALASASSKDAGNGCASEGLRRTIQSRSTVHAQQQKMTAASLSGRRQYRAGLHTNTSLRPPSMSLGQLPGLSDQRHRLLSTASGPPTDLSTASGPPTDLSTASGPPTDLDHSAITGGHKSSLNNNHTDDIQNSASVRFKPSGSVSTSVSDPDETETKMGKNMRTLKRHTSRLIQAVVQKAKQSRSKEAQDIANETKATRVLGIVFFCFFFCWTPFFVINVLTGVLGMLVPRVVITVSQWMGFVSSIINPIIYTIFNRRFRDAFYRIVLCRCGKRDLRQANVSLSNNYQHVHQAKSSGYSQGFSSNLGRPSPSSSLILSGRNGTPRSKASITTHSEGGNTPLPEIAPIAPYKTSTAVPFITRTHSHISELEDAVSMERSFIKPGDDDDDMPQSTTLETKTTARRWQGVCVKMSTSHTCPNVSTVGDDDHDRLLAVSETCARRRATNAHIGHVPSGEELAVSTPTTHPRRSLVPLVATYANPTVTVVTHSPSPTRSTQLYSPDNSVFDADDKRRTAEEALKHLGQPIAVHESLV